MDYYTKKYLEVKMLAKTILTTRQGQNFALVDQDDAHIGAEIYFLFVKHWYSLCSYRVSSDPETTERNLNLAVREWIRAAAGNGRAVVFLILYKHGVYRVYYGTTEDTKLPSFESHIPECDLRPSFLEDHVFTKNGLFTGTLRSANLADTLASSKLGEYYVACILLPVADSEMRQLIASDRDYVGKLHSCRTYHRIYGSATRRDEEIEISEVAEAISVLKEEMEYYQRKLGEGFVRTVVRYGASSIESFNRLTAAIQSGFVYEDSLGYVPPQHFDLRGVQPHLRDCISVPTIRVPVLDHSEEIHALTLQDIGSAASFCLPPTRSCQGICVKNYSIDEDSLEAFPLTSSEDREGIRIGKEAEGRGELVVPLSLLHSHAFVTGATESGKTNTIKQILTGLQGRGIPFTVIEAAKKEYYKLLETVPELRIYTAGADGEKLMFNPLQPEDGVLIENHIHAVVRALLASSGGEHPIPEAFEGLLKQTYARFGWEYGMLSFPDERRPFPTFRDVFENVESYISRHAKYGPEVRMNLTAALSIRTEAMRGGTLGNLFCRSFGLQARDLLNTPSIVELSDFSEGTVTFLMNILLFKFQSYLSRQPECKDLKRVIVLEEAHNVFRKTLSEESGRALNNVYFEKMLAEIRASGTGLVICDQRPSILSDAVEANTSVKIVHALESDADREEVGRVINASDLQIRKMLEFGVGECVLSLRGVHGLRHGLVDPVEKTATCNPACAICGRRFSCISSAVEKMLESSSGAVLEYHVARIIGNPYNPAILEKNIDAMLQELNVVASSGTKLCFLGKLLRKYRGDSEQENRIITNTYNEYLKRRNVS
ncbi:MAG: ATP-binding protein [Clostridiales bacterium]|nr:ATP-binding protein [Clostridiales bacterium]